MPGHEFMLKLNRAVTDEEIEALYEAGCSDASVETGALGTMLDFTRAAPSLAEALVSAVRDIEKVPGLRAVGVVCDDVRFSVVGNWPDASIIPRAFKNDIPTHSNSRFLLIRSLRRLICSRILFPSWTFAATSAGLDASTAAFSLSVGSLSTT